MFRTALAATLLALAAAQESPASPQLEAVDGDLHARMPRDGDLRVTRQTTVDVAEALDRIEHRLIPQVINQAQLQAYNATLMAMATNRAEMNALTATVNGVNANVVAQLSSMQTVVTAQMTTMTETMSNQAAALRDEMEVASAALRAEITEDSSEMAASISTSIATVTSTLTQASATSAAQVDAAISTMLVQNTAMNVSLNSQLAGKADAAVHMWTGGCASSGSAGWREMCLNQAHVNTAMPYFSAGSTRFTARRHGYFSLNVWFIGTTSGWQHTQLYMANLRKTSGSNREAYHEGGNAWRDYHMFCMFPERAGQVHYIRSYVDSWTNWHATNSRGEHSRITSYYVGVWNP